MLNTFNLASVNSIKAGGYLQAAHDWLRNNREDFAWCVTVGGFLTGLSFVIGSVLMYDFGFTRTASFAPQFVATLFVGYVLHARSTCRGEQLCWKTNGKRWAAMRSSQLGVGIALSAFLLPHIFASDQLVNVVSGLVVGAPTYWILKKWALKGQAKEAMA